MLDSDLAKPNCINQFSLRTNNLTQCYLRLWITGRQADTLYEYEGQRKTCPMQMCVIRTPPTSGILLIGSPNRECIPIQYTIHSSTDSQSLLSMGSSLRIVASTHIVACNEA